MGLLELFDSIEAKAGAEPGEKAVTTPVENGSGRAECPLIAAFRKSFPPGTESIQFNQEAMDAIKAGYPVRVWLGVVSEWAWWVRGEAEREKLLAEGCKLPIYTLGELAVIVNMSDQAVKNMHAYKREFNAVIGPASRNGKQSK